MLATGLDPSEMALAVIAECEEREEVGRTSIQKVAYFACVSMGLDVGHQAHLYGPYSRLLEREIDALVFAGEVRETRVRLGFAGDFGEGVQYRYALGDAGRARYRELKTAQPDAIGKLREVIRQVEAVAGDLGQQRLSPAAKTFYLVARQGSVSGFDEVQELAQEYGWTLDPHQRDDIVRLLKSLGLIEETQED